MTTASGDAGASRRDVVARPPVTLSALWWPVMLGLLGAGFAIAAILASVDRNPYPWWVAAPTQAVGLVFLAAGLFVWTRQPGDWRMGGLMVAVGITYYFGDLQFTGSPLLLRLGFWLYHVNVVVLAHLLLAYPDGRLTRRIERFTVAAMYAVTVTTQGLRMLTERPLEPQGWGAPQAPLSMWAPIGSTLGIALTAVVVVLVVQRWRAEPGPARRARGLFWAAVILIGVVVVAISAASLAHAPVTVQGALLLVYAVAQLLLGGSVVIGALRTHMAHQRVTRFLAHIEPRAGGGGALRDALAEALEDPTLTLHYPRADSDEYVDSHGSPAPLPTGTDRTVTWVTGPAGQPLAALAHDPFLSQQPHARQRLEAVVAAASLALENARLHAENPCAPARYPRHRTGHASAHPRDAARRPATPSVGNPVSGRPTTQAERVRDRDDPGPDRPGTPGSRA